MEHHAAAQQQQQLPLPEGVTPRDAFKMLLDLAAAPQQAGAGPGGPTAHPGPAGLGTVLQEPAEEWHHTERCTSTSVTPHPPEDLLSQAGGCAL